MVYGIVQYDFNAERPDELEAKAGEAIIVIAQSNPEWFVAKPIGRLGGPGLIPVSFIEIRDMTTGDAVLDVQGVVARAGVPKVEDWKRMVADYKNSSITLGKFEGGGPRESERMSPGGGGRPPTSSNGNGSYVSRQPLTDGGCLIFRRRTVRAIINEMAAEFCTRATVVNRSIVFWRPYRLRSLDTASKMTNTGTSLNA